MMKRGIIQNSLLSLAVVILIAFISGCATTPTKPNIPYSGPLQELNEIAKKNSLLATELRKLPELRDGISAAERDALKNLVKMYDNAPDAFDSTFDEMYKVGLPNVRKYCSPLQAIFWLVEGGKHEACYKTLNSCDLDYLLNKAWDFTDNDRWRNYEIVTERLNSPMLLNYYEQKNLKYKSNVGATRFKNAYEVFRSKSGACTEYTIFTFYCLKKAGYKVRGIRVKSPTRHPKGHAVCEYEENGQKYVFDNSCWTCTGGKGIIKSNEYLKRLPIISTDLFSIDGESII